MKKTVFYTTLGIILLMHTVGFYGILYSNNRNYYIDLTWVNLLVTGICFLLYSFTEHKNNLKYFIAFMLVCVAGFLVEVLGIKTGKIFGTYFYSDRLGSRLWDVPLIIGLNWALLIFAVAAIANRIYQRFCIKVIVGATLLVLLDFLIEPVAMDFFYWTWDTKIIPVQNFIAWWIVALLLLLFCFAWVKNMNNRMGIWLYMIQFIFFSLLNLLL